MQRRAEVAASSWDAPPLFPSRSLRASSSRILGDKIGSMGGARGESRGSDDAEAHGFWTVTFEEWREREAEVGAYFEGESEDTKRLRGREESLESELDFLPRPGLFFTVSSSFCRGRRLLLTCNRRHFASTSWIHV